MAVVTFDHENARPHLLRKSVNISAVLRERESRIRVTQAVESAILTRSRAFKQSAVLQERLERLTQILVTVPSARLKTGMLTFALSNCSNVILLSVSLRS